MCAFNGALNMVTSRSMKAIAIAAAVLCGLLLALLLGTDIPIGIPNEWTWNRTPSTDSMTVNFLVVLLGFILMAALAFAGMKAAKLRRERIIIACLIMAIGCWVDYNLLSTGFVGCYESVLTILEPYSTGYLTQAGTITDPTAFARTFHERIARDADRHNHTDVHPLGNTMLSYAAIHCVEKAWIPDSVVRLFLQESTIRNGRESFYESYYRLRPPTDSVRSLDVLFAAAERLFVIFLVAAFLARLLIFTAVLVLHRGGTRNLCIIALLLSTALYGPIVFLGHYDTLLYFFGAVCALLLALSLRHDRPKLAPWALLSGAALACSCLFSLAFLALCLLAALLFLMRYRWREGFLRGCWLFCGAALVVIALECCGVRVLSMGYYAWRNNGRFFAASTRTSCLWPAFNALDLVMFESPALVLPLLAALPLAARKLCPAWRPAASTLRWRGFPAERCGATAAWLAALLPVLAILLISGFSKGEMGRLFLFLLPCIAVGACLLLGSKRWSTPAAACWMLAALLSAFLATAIRSTLFLIFGFWGE